MAVTTVMAQKKSVINLISSESVQGVKINGVDVLKVYKATFQQDYSTLQSDSAYIHQKENTFDAFGHVVIIQGDTLHIYSDILNYNGNTKVAILTNNVKMVDKDATLTTNHLTYNTATRIGTYTDGGKLVNKDNTLTSKNGYYFAQSRDSYFRYDVRLVTPDALILTDTMRYNTGSRIAYFYGPTNIYGKKKGKDNDTLYTENGTYNTVTEQAFFGKKNLYRQGTKTLKGDSLFYDRKKGLGRAVKNVTFNDNEQKMTLKGDLANYYKANELTVVTENAYAVIVTEEKDTTKKDSLAKPVLKSNESKKTTVDTAKLIPVKTVAGVNKSEPQSVNKVRLQDITITAKSQSKNNRDSTANAHIKQKKTDSKLRPADSDAIKKDTAKIKRDSIYLTADTLETRILTYKDLKDLLEARRLANIIDTNKRAPSIVYKKAPKYIDLSSPRLHLDTISFHREYFGRAKPKPVTKKKAEAPAKVKKISKQDSIKNSLPDSAYLQKKIGLSDTSRIRILSAYHHVKIFKSDLQGKSDSAFYSNSDSTIRLFVHPLIWTQGSQLSGDTIYLQMKNKKLDNMDLFPNAFIVNIEKKDSVHFNQSAGKKMRGFFKDGKLERMYIVGNAESISFPRDSNNKVTEMHRSLSSRIRVNFRDGKLAGLTFLSKPEHRYGPLDKFTEDDKVLKGFIWKPKERPVSKESIIPSLDKNYHPKPKAKPPATGKTLPGVKAGKDTGAVKPGNIPAIKTGKDTSVAKPGTLPVIKAAKDSTLKNQPPVKTGKDSTAKKPVAKPVQ